MFQENDYQNRIKMILENENSPLSQIVKQSLINDLTVGNRIYPKIYSEKFGVSVKEIVSIMNVLIDKNIVNLRFEVDINDDTTNELYTLKTLPIYKNGVKLDESHYVPVYEVAKC